VNVDELGDLNIVKGRASVCNGFFLRIGPYNVKVNPRDSSGISITENGILREGNKAFPVETEIIREPAWARLNICDGKKVRDILKPELNGIIATTLFGCQLKREGIGCSFCASKPYDGMNFTLSEFEAALDKIPMDQVFGLTLNSGSIITDNDRGYSLMRPYIQIAKRRGIPTLNIELMPPYENEEEILLRLRDDGVTSVQFNAEIWDPKLARVFMPYKGKIPRERYLECITAGARILGEGKVSSVLLLGIENRESLERGVNQILDAGGVPSLEVLRPLYGTPLQNLRPGYTPEEMVKLITELNRRIYTTLGDDIMEGLEGCLRCGGCPTLMDIYSERR